MERSQSCVNFKLGCAQLTQEEEEAVQQQQQSQQQQHSNSSDNLYRTKTTTMAAAAAAAATTYTTTNTLPPNKPLRRRKLQRQTATSLDHDDYAADLEEEATPEHKLATRLHKQQQQLQQKALSAFNAATNKRHSSDDFYTITKTAATTTTPQLKYAAGDSSFDSSSTANTTTTTTTTASSTSSSYGAITNNNNNNNIINLIDSPLTQRHAPFNLLMRDSSVQSDSSRYSSVDSLLEARKPDPEAILINLGFGPAGSEDILSRIPKRFLKPSQVRGIDTEAFVKRLQLATSLAESSVMGFRGLTGNPDVPPSSIVAKIMERFEVNQRKKSLDYVEHTIR